MSIKDKLHSIIERFEGYAPAEMAEHLVEWADELEARFVELEKVAAGDITGAVSAAVEKFKSEMEVTFGERIAALEAAVKALTTQPNVPPVDEGSADKT